MFYYQMGGIIHEDLKLKKNKQIVCQIYDYQQMLNSYQTNKYQRFQQTCSLQVEQLMIIIHQEILLFQEAGADITPPTLGLAKLRTGT